MNTIIWKDITLVWQDINVAPRTDYKHMMFWVPPSNPELYLSEQTGRVIGKWHPWGRWVDENHKELRPSHCAMLPESPKDDDPENWGLNYGSDKDLLEYDTYWHIWPTIDTAPKNPSEEMLLFVVYKGQVLGHWSDVDDCWISKNHGKVFPIRWCNIRLPEPPLGEENQKSK